MGSPRIYVASLTDYNNGQLHGKWIDADQDADSILEETRAMLADSPTARKYGEIAEEWAIHDYDCFGGVKIEEYESFENVATLAHAIGEYPTAVISDLLEKGYDAAEVADKAMDLYCGEWEGYNETDAVAEMIYSEHLSNDKSIPEHLHPHLGAIADSMAHDAICGGDYHGVYAGNGITYVLRADI